MRIASLVPSATETLFAVGKGSEIVGRTHECNHPPTAQRVPAVTTDLIEPGLPPAEIDAAVRNRVRDQHTMYRLDTARLRALRPDVVITQALCEVCAAPRRAVDQALCTLPATARIVATDPQRLEDAWDSIAVIGEAAGAADEGATLAGEIRRQLVRLRKMLEGRERPRVAIIEWPDPPYAPGHWVPDMVEAAGGVNVFGEAGGRSIPTPLSRVADARPDVVVLAFCGYGLLETQAQLRGLARHAGWRRIARSARVIAADGSAYFSRPGPRLLDGIGLLAWAMHGIHPGLQPPPGRGAELIEAGWVDLASLPARTRSSA